MDKQDWTWVGKFMLMVTYVVVTITGFVAVFSKLVAVLFAALSMWVAVPISIIVMVFILLMILIGGIILKDKVFE